MNEGLQRQLDNVKEDVKHWPAWKRREIEAIDVRKQQRDIIDTIDRILKIPLPASGAQSTTVAGLASYAADMRELVPRGQQLIWILRQGETYPGEARDLLDETNQAIDRRLQMIQE